MARKLFPPIENSVNDFILSRRADGLKPKTVQGYAGKLAPFSTCFQGITLDTLTASDLRQYVMKLRERQVLYPGQARETKGNLSNESLRGHDRILRLFFNWCEHEYDLAPAANPMRKIRPPKKQEQLPKAIALEDLKLMLHYLLRQSSTITIRDLAILLFLVDTGCRAGGLLTLTPDRLNLDRFYATLREKGDRIRTVPFTLPTAEAIRRWLEVRPVTAAPVFCALGTNTVGMPLTLSGLHNVLKRTAQRAGAKGRFNPHSIRHAFARQCLRNGLDLATLSRLMGHSNIGVTTDFYAVFTPIEQADRHKQYSPIRNVEDVIKSLGGTRA